jgi:hypothetical protein
MKACDFFIRRLFTYHPKRKDNTMEQLNLFDAAAPVNEPRYGRGDHIYKVTLDVSDDYVVDTHFSLGADITGERTAAGHTLWRYHLNRVKDGAHEVFGEYEMGDTYFDTQDEAEAHAEDNRRIIEGAGLVVRAPSLALTEVRGFVRRREGRCLIAGIGRLGARGVYDRQFYCYPFLYVFPTERDALRFYRKALAEIQSEPHETAEGFAAETLYKVSDGCWSSLEFAARNGDWSVLGIGAASGRYLPKLGGALSADGIQQVLAERATKTAKDNIRDKGSERGAR